MEYNPISIYRLTMKSFSLSSLAQDVENLLRTVFAKSLESGDASLSIEKVKSENTEVTKLAVIPKYSGPAEVYVLCERGVDLIYLTIGQHTSLEIPLEGQRYTRLFGAEEFIAIVRAVLGGRFEEEIWSKGSKVVKTLGRIYLEQASSPIRIVNSQKILASWFCSTDKQVFKYLPYN